MKLDVAAARAAVATVADTIGLSVPETAFRILGLATDLMVRAVGDVTINDGVNPRESTIVAGGGAAGVNIIGIASELGCSRVILPKTASTLSAAGMQFADIAAEEAASLVIPSNRFDFDGVNAVLAELTRRLEAFRVDKLSRADDYRIEYFGEARYLSQVWELDTPLAGSRFETQADLDTYLNNFHDVHERVFAVRDTGSPIETVSWKARLTVRIARPVPPSEACERSEPAQATTTRDCYFGAEGYVATPILKAEDLREGQTVTGPAIIEEATTTLVVAPGKSVAVSGAGNYLLGTAA
jgi:N-methylhydantoinase A